MSLSSFLFQDSIMFYIFEKFWAFCSISLYYDLYVVPMASTIVTPFLSLPFLPSFTLSLSLQRKLKSVMLSLVVWKKITIKIFWEPFKNISYFKSFRWCSLNSREYELPGDLVKPQTRVQLGLRPRTAGHSRAAAPWAAQPCSPIVCV